MRGTCGALAVASAVALLLSGCSSEPEPVLVGATGDLHVSPDGGMLFCESVIDTGFGTDCRDGVPTAGIDRASLAGTPGDTVVLSPRGERSTSPGGLVRTLEDGTRVYSLFLVGTRDADVFTVSSIGTADHTLPDEYRKPDVDVPGGFLVPVVPTG
ncbi:MULTISPECIES: hypothetical protein [unclassified Rathayibacter]|uniref:hypothetical protein n=1 Tax=unclassified Rathayibacter TaxID=2609250 RepID=UPI00104F0101|nr:MULTISPECIES: hypothetical protein [unclassified Rathayibacter]TCL82597.1 hypothetical protein EDF49_105151 [Rathayibacter sp. PhB192]TCM27936.1 hypothetical protein EDF43_105151 [Rathayibacter sp. PhB179]